MSALAAAGEAPDWLGDALVCNEGEHSTRHHAVNRAWQRALAAVATGSVLLGDKEEKDKYKMYNEGYVPDLVRPGASAWGTDWVGESKVASPLTKGGPGTGCQEVGHTHAFGSTEEPLRRTVLGCRKRGVPTDGPYNHATGQGFVEFHAGDYYDALPAARTTRSRCCSSRSSAASRAAARGSSASCPGAPRTRSGAVTAPSTPSTIPRTTSPTTSPRSAWRPCTRTPATSTTA